MRRPVNLPVTATLSPVELRLFPYEEVETEHGTHMREPIIEERPWAWGALCRVTFHFGTLVTTKRVTSRSIYWGRSAFGPDEERPSDFTLGVMREDALDRLAEKIRRHGIDVTVADFEVQEESP